MHLIADPMALSQDLSSHPRTARDKVWAERVIPAPSFGTLGRAGDPIPNMGGAQANLPITLKHEAKSFLDLGADAAPGRSSVFVCSFAFNMPRG